MWDLVIVVASALLGGFYVYPWIHKRWGKIASDFNHAWIKSEGAVRIEQQDKVVWQLHNFQFNDKMVTKTGIIEFILVVWAVNKCSKYMKED